MIKWCVTGVGIQCTVWQLTKETYDDIDWLPVHLIRLQSGSYELYHGREPKEFVSGEEGEYLLAHPDIVFMEALL